MKQPIVLVICAVVGYFVLKTGCTQHDPTYNYKNKTFTSVRTDWFKDEEKARKAANNERERKSDRACRKDRYGWHLDSIVDSGKVVCKTGPRGHACQSVDVLVKCIQSVER
ncbi:MAG: hypothetical protein VX679_03930 [Pseudomonadota bacterium]|jgi:hypothetical protein|nr:hypothetical protein [Pseudomonadota bacterium]